MIILYSQALSLPTKDTPFTNDGIVSTNDSPVLLTTVSIIITHMLLPLIIHLFNPQTHLNSSIDQPILISSSPMKEEPSYWLKHLDLTFSDKLVLQSSAWLNDAIIFAAQVLLKKQSDGICGWKSTQCSKRVGEEKFPRIPQGAPFVQILHVSNNHWITVSNIKQGTHTPYPDVVRVYDSGWSPNISLETKELICNFLKPEKDVIFFDIMNVHAQPNLTDCGLFAVAFATELVHGEDPVLCNFDCAGMRTHLLAGLEAGLIGRFPCKKKRRVPLASRVRKSIRELIYCTCRTPNNTDKAMIECDNCKRWFHTKCEGVEAKETFKGKQWRCSLCIDFVKSLTK